MVFHGFWLVSWFFKVVSWFQGFWLVSMVFQGGFMVFHGLVGFHGFFKVVSWFIMVFGWFPWFTW